MASVGAIKAGAAYVSLESKDTTFSAGLKAAQARMATLGKSVQAVGRTIGDAGQTAIKFGIGLAIPLGLAAKTFAGFEQSMSGVKAILQEGGGFGAEQFEALNKEALRLGAATKFSAGEAAQAMEVLAKAGFDADTILKATGQVLDLAAAGGLGLAEAAGVATVAMKTMGIPASELVSVTDTLAKASTMAFTDVQLLGAGLAKIGPDASRLGISFNDTVAALMLLNDAGRQGEEAGVGLRSMLMSLVNPTKEAEAALADLGVKLWEGGKFRGLPALFESLNAASLKKTPEEMSKALGTIFTNVGGSSAAAILNRVSGGASLAGLSKQLDAPGAGARMARERMNNLSGSVETLMSNLEGLGNVIGKAVSPVLREWSAMLGGVIGAVANWAQANPQVFQGLTRIALSAVAGGAALMALGGVLKAVGVAVSGFGLIVTPVWLIYWNKWFFSIRQVASGIGILAGTSETGRNAMAALGTFLSGLWSDMVAGASAAFESVRQTAVSVWPVIAESLKAGDLTSALSVAGAAINLEMVKLTNVLMGTWNTFFDWLKNKFASAHELAMQGPAYRGGMQALGVVGAVGGAAAEIIAKESSDDAIIDQLNYRIKKMKEQDDDTVSTFLGRSWVTRGSLREILKRTEGDADAARLRELVQVELDRRGAPVALPDYGAEARKKKAAEEQLLREMGADAAEIDAQGELDRRARAAKEAARVLAERAEAEAALKELRNEMDRGQAERLAPLAGAAAGAAKTPDPTALAGEVAGSFNALVSGLLGPKNVAQKQLEVAQQQLEVQKNIDRKTGDGGRFG